MVRACALPSSVGYVKRSAGVPDIVKWYAGAALDIPYGAGLFRNSAALVPAYMFLNTVNACCMSSGKGASKAMGIFMIGWSSWIDAAWRACLRSGRSGS